VAAGVGLGPPFTPGGLVLSRVGGGEFSGALLFYYTNNLLLVLNQFHAPEYTKKPGLGLLIAR